MKVLSTLIITVLITATTILNFNILSPIKITDDKIIIQKKLKHLGASEHKAKIYATAFKLASHNTSISPDVLIALMYTESAMNEKAKSIKNYRGLMQIPWSIPYPDANIFIGAKILQEKLEITNGDLLKALYLYKGWGNNYQKGRGQVNQVVFITKKLKEII